MITYSIFEWIAFFMLYCLVGWIYESLLVSWEMRKWTNRGFLNGPFLPIYGVGAIVMLFSTLEVRDNVLLTFLFGMLGATVIEYFSGAAMEKLFRTRYWDYSNELFNLNGHICLKCSLVWGIASVLLVNYIQDFAEKLIHKVDSTALIVIDIMFVVYFIWDLVISLRQAMDLRKFVDEYIMQNEKVQHLQKRLDVLIAVTEDSKEKFEERMEAAKDEFKEKLHEGKQEIKKRISEKRAMLMLKRNPKASIKSIEKKIVRLKEILKR